MFTHALDIAIKLAQLLTALGALLLIFVAGPRELKRFRRSKLAERRAAAAATAVVAAVDVLQAIDRLSPPVCFLRRRNPEAMIDDSVFKRDQDAQERFVSTMEDWFDRSRTEAQPLLQALSCARVQALIYLDDDQLAVLDSVRECHFAVLQRILDRYFVPVIVPQDDSAYSATDFESLTWTFLSHPGGREELERRAKTFAGVPEQVAVLTEQLMASLRPSAQFR